ncbi:MAG: ribonuclease P protein component [Clostridiales bacterium]|jgi:ribonuclease P protein component|nr:ribonuclease P protein component [Eubacteriales bacterium]MDH7567056.1 ribonuclease P protein component [Clostridiales bacterium]
MVKTVPMKKNYEFMRVYKRGKFFVGKFITLYVLKNDSAVNRLGITVSKKIGKSVKRNRIKRLVRENYRMFEAYTASGYDYVFVSRISETVPDFFDIRKEMKFLLKKLNVFDQEKWNCLKGC